MMSPHSNEPATWRNCVSRRHFLKSFSYFPYLIKIYYNMRSTFVVAGRRDGKFTERIQDIWGGGVAEGGGGDHA